MGETTVEEEDFGWMPELPTMVAIPGGADHAARGCQGVTDNGVVIALMVYSQSCA